MNSLLKGGYEPDFGLALAYAAAAAVTCFAMWWWMRGHAERLDSGLVRLDVKAWPMSALITSALLVAFATALALEDAQAEWLIPYMAPAVLALLSLVLLPMPLREARQALAEIFMISPPDLDAR